MTTLSSSPLCKGKYNKGKGMKRKEDKLADAWEEEEKKDKRKGQVI
jgi:hypothetical protein